MMQKAELETLEEKLQRIVSAQRSPSRVRVTPVSGADTLSASINHLTKEISFNPPNEWDITKYEKIRQFAQKQGIQSPEVKVCCDVSFHEVGHHKLRNDENGLGCPEDMVGKEVAVDAVSKALLEEGKFSQDGALYLENLIADIINNTNASRYTKYNGLTMFLAEQGELNKGKYSKLYEAFVKLNMHLWGTKRQIALVRSYYDTNNTADSGKPEPNTGIIGKIKNAFTKSDKKSDQPKKDETKSVDYAVAACIKDVGIGTDKPENIRLLFNKDDWSRIFYTMAKHLAKFMDESSPESLPGSGSGKQGYSVPAGGFEKEARFNPDTIGDAEMKRLLDPDNMKKMMMRRNDKGEDLPVFVENWRALDYFYQGLASEIIIKAESPKKGETMPIAPIQARQFDHDKDRVEDILFGKVLLDEHGKPCFSVPRGHVEYTVKYKKTIRSYPELNIAVLDNSISMIESANENGPGRTNIVPWGDNSKYHYALLSYYGVEKALHRMGVGIKTRYRLVTFSSSTEATRELGYEEKSEMKKKMLMPTFGGSTSIDSTVLAKSAREPGSILMTISDGAIQNWNSIRNDVRRVISDKYYVHFQIGADTETTRDLESWGANVVRIADASQMPRMAIDITRNFYKSQMSGEIQ